MQKIQSTKNYDIFIIPDENREKNKFNINRNNNHFNKLKASVEKKNLLHMFPITVDENYRVIDGQTRLRVAKALEVPIYYIISDEIELEDIIDVNNSQLSWNTFDYLNYYRTQGKEAYKFIHEIIEKVQLPLYVALVICGIHDDRHRFRSGRLELDKNMTMELVNKFVDVVKVLRENYPGKRHIFSLRFWRALKRVTNLEGFEFDRLISMIRMHPQAFDAKTNQQEYYQSFLDAYNWKLRNKLKDSPYD